MEWVDMLFVTGGSGFIGSNFILDWIACENDSIINYDALTYAGNNKNLSHIAANPRYKFIHGNILNKTLLEESFKQCKPTSVVHFAAESHVDRSITSSSDFLKTNVEGTYVLLEAVRSYWTNLNMSERKKFRFLHVSTDEVFGSLMPDDPAFSEITQYSPNSPYSASKAASDHFVRAWHHTYGLPTLMTNCSNNYGPYQFPEKLIPLVIMSALSNKKIPIYGDGLNVRDWLYVGDHCAAIRKVLHSGHIGETYNIGGHNEKTNLEIVHTICDILEELNPKVRGSYKDQIHFVTDRLGHDRRYAVDASKILKTLDWKPSETFETGIKKTVEWYLNHLEWVACDAHFNAPDRKQKEVEKPLEFV